ncbi:MAG: L-fucose mutarotase [Veillonellaceae bacterium]|nr:L-fucose mutarotase [Veillonellaceae bacterium]
MLIGISPLISPDLLATLSRMGHGDEIVLADAHFPGDSVNPHVIRADGIRIASLLAGILPLMALDVKVAAPLVMMAVSAGDVLDPSVESSYWQEVIKVWPKTPPIERIDRFAFYDRARKAFAIVMTGETATYANIILKKGVTPL